MIKRIRLFLSVAVLASAASAIMATPAHACFNPDEPTCQVRRAACYASEPLAKYRDKVAVCYP